MNLSQTAYRSIVILCAAVVGAIYVYPDLRFAADSGPQYKNIAPIGFSDETLYTGRINAVYNRKADLTNPVIYEHSRDPVVMPNIPEIVNALPGIILRLELAPLLTILKFFLPALLFILITVFSYDISGLRFGALAAGAAVVLGTHLFSKAFLFSGRIVNWSYTLPLWFARPITPQTHFIFFLPALISIYRALKSSASPGTGPRSAAYGISAGLFLGALFYVSVFYWAYIYSVLAILFFIYASRREAIPMRIIAVMISISLAVSVPYWLDNVRTIKDPNYGLLLYRFNIGYTHRPILPAPAIAVLLLTAIMKKEIIMSFGRSAFYLFVSMTGAIILTLNQQVITGRLFKESHWTTYTGKFAIIIMVVLSVCLFLKRLCGRSRRAVFGTRAIYASFLGMLLFHAISMQSNYYVTHYEKNLDLQDLSSVFSWLRANARPDSVVLASPRDIRLSELVPVHTDNFVYYSEPFFCLSLIPADETRYRMLASYRLFGFSPEEAASHPYAWDGALFLTNDTNRTAAFMEKARSDFIEGYKDMAGKDGLTLAVKYKADYVIAVVGKDDAVVKRLVDSGFKEVYNDGKFSVIKVRRRHV